MKKSERLLAVGAAFRKKGFGGFKQAQGSDDIGLHEGFGTVNRTVHVTFGGKIDYRIDFILHQDALERSLVANITSLKDVPGMVLKTGKIFRISSVSLLVQINDFFENILLQKHANEIRSDEAKTSGDQNRFHVVTSIFISRSDCRTASSTGLIPTPAFLAFVVSSTQFER